MRIFALMSEKSDIEIAIICQWDSQAIELLYDKYYCALVSYGCQFVEMTIAEDIVQDLFSVLWERRPFSTVFPSFPPIYIIRCITLLSITCVIKRYTTTIGRV